MSNYPTERMLVPADLLQRIDGILTLIYYRERTCLSDQTQIELESVIEDVLSYTRPR